MSKYIRQMQDIPKEFQYISDMPDIKEMECNKKGYSYVVIMIGVAAEIGAIIPLSDIYEKAKNLGYFASVTFTTVYASIKSLIEDKCDMTIKNFIYQKALRAKKLNK